jgi:hypothetical protein
VEGDPSYLQEKGVLSHHVIQSTTLEQQNSGEVAKEDQLATSDAQKRLFHAEEDQNYQHPK